MCVGALIHRYIYVYKMLDKFNGFCKINIYDAWNSKFLFSIFLFFSHSVLTGNLALSRALGDFVFKKNDTKKPEEQIVTGKGATSIVSIILKLLLLTVTLRPDI